MGEFSIRVGRRATLAALGVLGIAAKARAQQWAPSRPLRFLVGFPPGGSSDAMVRRLAETMSRKLGQPVVVENRTGANGHIAMDAVANGAPDGTIIGLSPMGPLAVNPALMPSRMSFNAATDFTPLVHVWDQPNVIVTSMDVPAPWPAFVAWLRSRRTEPYGSVGAGSSNHLTGEILSRALGLELTHVPYRGSPQALTDIMSGQLKIYVDNVTTTIPLAKEGRVRAMAVTTATRCAALPDVPTLAELGLGEVTISSWQVVVGPAGMPAPIVARLNAELDAAIREPATAAWQRAFGAEPVGGSAEAAAAMLARERERWARVIPQLNIRLD
ncbi:MAG: Bug family tripartite tricarboxylate transporter substrate binding protein [Lautropia sp.]